MMFGYVDLAPITDPIWYPSRSRARSDFQINPAASRIDTVDPLHG